jgi:hypothetical protein
MRKAPPSYWFLDNADCCHNRSSPLETLRSGRTLSEVRRSGPIKLNRMEVSVRTDHGQYPTSQMSRTDPFIVTGSRGDYKAQEVKLDGDLESRQEK